MPVNGPGDMPMLHRIEVDAIDMSLLDAITRLHKRVMSA